MRHRTVACLLVLTAGDYLLWDWSLAGNHDILSLLSGLTLLPLTAMSLVLLALVALGLLARLARASSRMTRSMRAHRTTATVERAPATGAPVSTSPSESQASSRRLAA